MVPTPGTLVPGSIDKIIAGVVDSIVGRIAFIAVAFWLVCPFTRSDNMMVISHLLTLPSFKALL